MGKIAVVVYTTFGKYVGYLVAIFGVRWHV